MLECEKIFGRKNFESYSEFYLALCMAAEMKRRDDQLDMSSMRVDKSILSKKELNYYKYLISSEAIHIDGLDPTTVESVKLEDIKYYLNTEGITLLKDKLVFDREDDYYWSPEVVIENYVDGPKEFRTLSNTGNLLMHIVAHMIICEYYGERKKKPLVIHFDGVKAKNTYYYVNLYSCYSTLQWFRDYVKLDVDFSNINVDVQYSIFCNNGQVAGRHKQWSREEKLKLLNDYGMLEGAIVILWQRSGICPSNVSGKVTSAIIARIDEIGDDFVAVTTIALNKTKEEITEDYYSIEEKNRSLFQDMLNFKPNKMAKILSLYELGIENYFLDEYMFITLLDKNEQVVKKITIDGKQEYVPMSGIDAIYWLLCQYGIEFDREMYRNMYNGGKDLMWDVYGDDSMYMG